VNNAVETQGPRGGLPQIGFGSIRDGPCAVPPPTSPPLATILHLFASTKTTETNNTWEHQPLGRQTTLILQQSFAAVAMPGAGKQPPEVQEHIKELLEAGFDPTTIHRRLKVGRSSIYRMKRCLQQHGTAYMPVELNKKNGRPKVLSAEQELVSCVAIFF
jgi:hypothetical protein